MSGPEAMRRLPRRLAVGLTWLLWGSGILPLYAAWRRRRRPDWTIVTYHRIDTPEADGGPDRVDPRRFRRHLEFYRRHYTVMTVGEAIDRLRSGSPPRTPILSITFDDGYRDNLTTALPILIAAGCRATLYITGEAVRDGLAPWTHRLAADLGAGGAADPGAVRRRVEQAKALPDPDRARLCADAERRSGGAGRGVAAMMSADDLLCWKSAGMEVGSHTLRHRVLSRLAPEDLRDELRSSRALLEQAIGAPVEHLAYPNGRPDDWNATVAAEAAASGYRSAVTTMGGGNGPGRDPFALRRFSIGNDGIPLLAFRLSGLLVALRALRAGPASRPAGPALRVAFIGARGVGNAYSGIERYYEEVGSRLAAEGHEVVAYCRSYFSPDVPVYRGIRVRRIPTVRAKHFETLLHTLVATLDVCFRRVDVVQFHALGSSPFAWVPRLFGKKTIVSVRGLDWQRAKWGWLARTCLQACEFTSVYAPNATSVVSRTLEEHYRRNFRRAVRYIPNGVGRPQERPAAAIRGWGLEPRGYLLYAGRLSPEKGLEALIDAHRAVADDCTLVLAGGSSYSGGYIETLRRRAGPGVLFTGFLTGAPLEELYSNALAFVLPSRMEGLSVALLEALTYGLPVIASDIPENRELVNECGGMLFRLGDTADLERALCTIVRDREAARRIGEAARRRVRTHFDWDLIARQTAQFYREVARGDVAGPVAAAEARTR